MMKKRFRTLSVAAVAIAAAFLLLPQKAGAQQPSLTDQLPQGFRDDPYVKELITLVSSWNNKDLKLQPREVIIKQLQQRVDAILRSPRYSYQNNAWAQEMIKQASDLPMVGPKVRVSDPAASVLMALFIKDLDQYKRDVKLDAVKEQLQTPFYLILSRAQALLRPDAQIIDVATMIRSVFSWWTTVWPFCDK